MGIWSLKIFFLQVFTSQYWVWFTTMPININHHAWEMGATFLNKGRGWSVKINFDECITTKGVLICQVNEFIDRSEQNLVGKEMNTLV